MAEAHGTYRTGDPVPETAASKIIRETAKRGFKSHAFAAAYGTKYRLNPQTLQWYPAELEYDIMSEKLEYFARLLGEAVVGVRRDAALPHRVIVNGALGTTYVIDTLARQVENVKSSNVCSEANADTDAPPSTAETTFVPTTNPGAENWEKILGNQAKAMNDMVGSCKRKTTREAFNELEAVIEKKMRGLAALVYEAERCADGERKEAMEAILREAINSFRRRALPYIG